VLKESTGALCIGSVLIATVTFGATFAVPGGYIADDHSNGGSPILARRYALEGFIWLITCLAAAFALAAYVVLAPVAQNTAHGIAILTCLVLLYNQLEFISTRLLLLPPLCTRKGLIQACLFSALTIMGAMLLQYWPLIFIFQLANLSPKIEAPASAPVPAPLAST